MQGSNCQRTELTDYGSDNSRASGLCKKKGKIWRENQRFRIWVDSYEWLGSLWLGLSLCQVFWGALIPRLDIEGQEILSRHTFRVFFVLILPSGLWAKGPRSKKQRILWA